MVRCDVCGVESRGSTPRSCVGLFRVVFDVLRVHLRAEACLLTTPTIPEHSCMWRKCVRGVVGWLVGFDWIRGSECRLSTRLHHAWHPCMTHPCRASLMLPISTAFIVAMVGMDQAVCWLLCYETPKVCIALLPRRHHCRHCGRAVCQECPGSQTWCSLTYPTPPFPSFPSFPPPGAGKDDHVWAARNGNPRGLRLPQLQNVLNHPAATAVGARLPD